MTATRISHRIEAPPRAVYRALLDPQAVATWMVPDGMSSQVHEFDAREGGRFRISLTYDAPSGTGKTAPQRDTYHGRFLRLSEDREVVQSVEFETSDPNMQGEMIISMTLVDRGGATELVAVHDRLPPGLSPEQNEVGWRMSLAKLGRLVEEP